MTDYHIVFNEETARYRVERRRWWGWGFLTDASGENYATFNDFDGARRFACQQSGRFPEARRRWRIIGICDRVCPGNATG